MRTLPFVAVLAGASTAAGVAHAQPKPAVCLPSYVERGRVVVSKKKTLACWVADSQPEKCLAVSPTAALRSAPSPRSAAPIARVRRQGGQLSACRGATCKKLGKQVLAAIAQAKVDAEASSFDDAPAMKVSPDLKVIVAGRTAFSLVTGTPLELRPPAEYDASAPRPALLGVDIVGSVLISNWADCAGPCGRSVVFDANGANKGAWFPTGEGYVLDDRRVAILSTESDSRLTILDVATAAQLGTLTLGDGAAENLFGGRIDAQTVAILAPADDAWTVQWLSLPAGKPPSLGLTRTIPKCP